MGIAPTTDPTTSQRLSRQRTRDTAPEVAIRSIVHRTGLRYRIHVRPLPFLRREADMVFGPAKVAVFVDGCFWHQCPAHATQPKSNGAWWAAKLKRNIERDLETDQTLRANGWDPIRIWEHEDPREAAKRIEAAVRARRPDPLIDRSKRSAHEGRIAAG